MSIQVSIDGIHSNEKKINGSDKFVPTLQELMGLYVGTYKGKVCSTITRGGKGKIFALYYLTIDSEWKLLMPMATGRPSSGISREYLSFDFLWGDIEKRYSDGVVRFDFRSLCE